MIELLDKAGKYADGKANAIIDKAIAQAYADGYRDGYADREKEIPMNYRENKTIYVDLGLPSGTLWAASFETNGEGVTYFPYERAVLLDIPTIEQWNELINLCKWDFVKNSNGTLYRADCAGPNGRVISFYVTGLINAIEKRDHNESFFWIKEDIDGNEKRAVHIYRPYTKHEGKVIYYSDDCTVALQNKFSGYKLPIRLVRKK
jgi:hypothetical protein